VTPSWRSQAPLKTRASAEMTLISPGTGLPFHFRAGLGSQFRLTCKEPDAFIIRIEGSQDWRAIGFFHHRAATTSGVCAGFARLFYYEDFSVTNTILTVVDLAFGQGDMSSEWAWLSVAAEAVDRQVGTLFLT
jgi:hypothetical protein